MYFELHSSKGFCMQAWLETLFYTAVPCLPCGGCYLALLYPVSLVWLQSCLIIECALSSPVHVCSLKHWKSLPEIFYYFLDLARISVIINCILCMCVCGNAMVRSNKTKSLKKVTEILQSFARSSTVDVWVGLSHPSCLHNCLTLEPSSYLKTATTSFIAERCVS